jgi:hypothetical protein
MKRKKQRSGIDKADRRSRGVESLIKFACHPSDIVD